MKEKIIEEIVDNVLNIGRSKPDYDEEMEYLYHKKWTEYITEKLDEYIESSLPSDEEIEQESLKYKSDMLEQNELSSWGFSEYSGEDFRAGAEWMREQNKLKLK